MRRVWLTATAPRVHEQAEGIARAGFAVLKAPVLGIEHQAVSVPERGELAIVMSQHAVQAVHRNFSRYLAVGAATGQAMRVALDVDVAVASPQTSEGVVAWLQQHPVVGDVVLFAGVGGRATVAEFLSAQGVPFVKVSSYRRVLLNPTVAPLAIDGIVLGSGDGAEQAAKVWFAAKGSPQVPVVVPSARVEALARQAGFQSCHVADGTSVEATVGCLRRIEN